MTLHAPTSETAAAGSYSLGGLALRSELPLPELLSGNGADADVTIRLATVAPAQTPTASIAPGWAVSADTVELDMPEAGRYRIRHGREILVDPAPNAPPARIRLFLLALR